MATPTIYSDELVATICGRMCEGESLNKILKDDGMPCYKTVMLWIKKYPDFAELYKYAQYARAETLAEEMIEIADEVCTIVINEEGEETKVVFDSAAVARNRLRVDARKWNASKMHPKYSDRVAVVGDADAPPIAHKVDVTLTPDEAYLRMIGK